MKAPDPPPRLQHKEGPKLALGLLAALVVLAGVETTLALTARWRVPGDGDWRLAAAAVRARMRDGDLIVFAPRWVDQLGRMYLGDRVPRAMAARADADRYARVWELSIRGAGAPEVRGAHLIEETRHGRVRVRLYEKAAVAVVYDFTAHLGEARVTQTTATGNAATGNAGETPCYREPIAVDGDADAFRCAATKVERRTLEVDYAPHLGVLVPVDGARTTRLEWSDVELGDGLVGYLGLHDYYARKSGDGPVDVRIAIDGRPALELRYMQREGWRRIAVPAPAPAGGRHQVRVEVSAPNPAWRSFGFHLESRRCPGGTC